MARKRSVYSADKASKLCTKCDRFLPLCNFGVDGKNTQRLHSRCNDCCAKAAKDRRAANSDPLSSVRRSAINYGLDPEEIVNLFKAHNGLCDICGSSLTGYNGHGLVSRLHIDHDHTTGNFRGWLCAKCNHGLGNFNDNADFLLKAAQYLHRDKDRKWLAQ